MRGCSGPAAGPLGPFGSSIRPLFWLVLVRLVRSSVVNPLPLDDATWLVEVEADSQEFMTALGHLCDMGMQPGNTSVDWMLLG